MLIKTNQTFDAAGKASYEAQDYKLVGPDGNVYDFKSVAKDAAIQVSELKTGTIIADGSVVKTAKELTTITYGSTNKLTNALVLGAGVDETQVIRVNANSVLASGSSVTINEGSGVAKLEFNTTSSLKYVSGVLTYEDSGTSVSVDIDVGKSLTLDNGTVIRNDGGGKFTIESGSIAIQTDFKVVKGSATDTAAAIYIASQSELKANTVLANKDVTLVEAANYKVSSDGVLNNNVTLGNGINLDETKVDILAAGTVLARGSEITLDTNKFITLEVAGKELKVEYIQDGSDKMLKVGDQVVAAGKSITLEDGTILTHSADLANPNDETGRLTVTVGSIMLAREIDATASNTATPVTGYIITKDSTLAAGSQILQNTILAAGTVITDAEKQPPFTGSVTLAYNALGVQFSANSGNSLSGNLYETKVGESLTFVFNAYEASSSNLQDSIMSQIGANSGQTSFLSMKDMRCKALGVDRVDASTKWGAATGIETINNALQKVSHQRALLGAMQNRLEHTIKNLDVAAENLQAAEARIRDVDMAKEIMEFTKTNILQQASQAMLAQANQAPQSVLQLLR